MAPSTGAMSVEVMQKQAHAQAGCYLQDIEASMSLGAAIKSTVSYSSGGMACFQIK